MQFAIIKVRIIIRDSFSLKDKRMIIRGIKDRLRNLNLSIAEIDDLDNINLSTLGVSFIASSSFGLSSTRDKLICIIEDKGAEIVDFIEDLGGNDW